MTSTINMKKTDKATISKMNNIKKTKTNSRNRKQTDHKNSTNNSINKTNTTSRSRKSTECGQQKLQYWQLSLKLTWGTYLRGDILYVNSQFLEAFGTYTFIDRFKIGNFNNVQIVSSNCICSIPQPHRAVTKIW